VRPQAAQGCGGVPTPPLRPRGHPRAHRRRRCRTARMITSGRVWPRRSASPSTPPGHGGLLPAGTRGAVLRQALERNGLVAAAAGREILRLFARSCRLSRAAGAAQVGFLGPRARSPSRPSTSSSATRSGAAADVDRGGLHEVESGTADFGVVPIENSSEGTVNSTLDMFLISPLGSAASGASHPPQPHGADDGPRPGAAHLRHPQALAQCRDGCPIT